MFLDRKGQFFSSVKSDYAHYWYLQFYVCRELNMPFELCESNYVLTNFQQYILLEWLDLKNRNNLKWINVCEQYCISIHLSITICFITQISYFACLTYLNVIKGLLEKSQLPPTIVCKLIPKPDLLVIKDKLLIVGTMLLTTQQNKFILQFEYCHS